jgi:hypothetical protein
MFEAVIAMCVVFEIGGNPANPCWMRESDQIWRTYEACRSWGDDQELRLTSKAATDYDAAAVVHVACGEVDGGKT